jgi:PKD repeat protein
MDYNDFFSRSAYSWATSFTASTLLGLLKKAGHDSNSIITDPIYTSATDLHVKSALLRQGIPFKNVTTDIDGDKRNSTHPFIGADEFKVNQSDAALSMADTMNYTFCPNSSVSLMFKVKNTGYDTLRSVKIGWTTNGKAQKDTTWKGKLSLYGTSVLAFPYTPDTVTRIKAWTSAPNSVTDSTSEDDTISFTLTHARLPIAKIGATIGCPGNGTSFTDSSSSNGGANISSYYWDFGDGTASSTSKNVSHSYKKSGYYVVTHAVKGYCSDTIRKTIYIPRLIAAYKSYSYCLGDTTYFKDTSITDGVHMWFYKWLFGDGLSTFGPVANHIYKKPGTYKVILSIGSSLGCNDTISHFITIYAKPKARFSVKDVCQGENVSITDSSTGSALKYLWNFGDGSVDTARKPVHVYDTAGLYKIKLYIANPGGCYDTISHTIKVLAKPSVHFTSKDVCIGDTAYFMDSSVISGTAIYAWNFGDSTTSIIASPKHLYKHAGSYTVAETITTSGCTDTYTQTVTVYPKPDAHFSFHANHQHVSFSPADTSLKEYAWDFGDSITSSLKYPEHDYARSGHYVIRITTTNANGCSSSDTLSADIIYTDITSDVNTTNRLIVYPNPFDGQITVQYYLSKDCETTIDLYDMLGRKIQITPAQGMPAGEHFVRILSADYRLKPGIYYLQLQAGDSKTIKAIVKLN